MSLSINQPQHQTNQPGIESDMNPLPKVIEQSYQGSNKLQGKTAVITGGDSGIGRSVAVHFAREGASIIIIYLNEHSDAKVTQQMIQAEGQTCILIPGDIGDSSFCSNAIEQTMTHVNSIDILVNNAAEQHPQNDLLAISDEQLERTFRTNILGFFYMTKKALPHMKQGSSIINTSSITAYAGSKDLIDYSATKGAITTFTRSLSQSLSDQNIRVNAVAPGPIWTPLIPSTFDENKVAQFGSDVPMQRPGQPNEVAPAYVFLASHDATYITGQVLHVNGGVIVNG